MTKAEIKKAQSEVKSIYNLSKGRINIFGIGGISLKSKVKFGVNWSAIGTVPPNETEKFAKLLTKAAKIAKKWSGKFTAMEW